jgi:hypothetical protein
MTSPAISKPKRVEPPKSGRPCPASALGQVGTVQARGARTRGGIVLLGSNVSTLRETMAAMSAAEVLRSDLISRIDLRVVGDRTMKRI